MKNLLKIRISLRMGNSTYIRLQWKHKGRQCVILWVGSHFCAYVETKLKHVSYSQEFGSYETSPESNIEAHGGITFGGTLESFGDTYFFGCDYAHAGDYIADSIACEDGKKWTLGDVQKETIIMANSVIKYEKIHKKYKKTFDEFKKKLEKIKEGS